MSHDCCGKEALAPDQEIESTVVSEKVTTYKVSGMDCADEVAAIQSSFKISGVLRVDANIMRESVTVYHDRNLLPKMIEELILKAGLKVVKTKTETFYDSNSTRIFRVASSGLCLLVGLVLDWTDSTSVSVMYSFYFAALALAGMIIFPKAWRSFKKFHLDMNVLMTVAVVGAFLLKEYSEAASVVFLFSLAELLEAMSVDRARKAIKDVLSVAPKTANLVVEGNLTKEIDAELLTIGDLILVKPGDSIPVDGTIKSGSSSVNQASLTGESVPVAKEAGDTVWAGTVNGSSALRITVEKNFKDTKIAKVISLVEEAQAQKSPSQSFVDRFASVYTPAVLLLATMVAVVPPLFFGQTWEQWIYKALVLLVIGCPCALVIATPVSVVSGLTSLAKRGVLVKGGIHLEALGKLKAIALDKTGTITKGEPMVSELRSFSETSEEELIQITASLESLSSHPLAKAITRYAEERNVKYTHPENFTIVSGKGAEGDISGHRYFVGNHAMAHELGICTLEIEKYLETVENQAKSVIVLGHSPHDNCKGEILGVFSVGDEIKSGMTQTIQSFHHAGIKAVALLSGDNQKTVDSVAKAVGIDYAKGGLLPEKKVQEIKEMINTYKFVGMVGDGINDAPALAFATVGIAMGIAGSETAIETADIALMKDDLSELPKAIAHGKRVLRVIQFNIAFAILIKFVFFILAFIGQASLWMAVTADMGASLIVTFNALRLLNFSSQKLSSPLGGLLRSRRESSSCLRNLRP